jgi:cellulose biosynthesis protein BcsQ
MAAANVAWILASNGLRVLAIDWDLASPGLHRYFHPFLDDKQLRLSPGVMDMVRDYSGAVLDQGSAPAEPGWVLDYADPLRYAVSLNWQFPADGCLDLLPAGQQHAAYATAVSTFDWGAFLDLLDGGTFFKVFVDNLRKTYDAVLIDSRPGLSDSSGICTILLPDTVVACFTMSAQSIDGVAHVARSIVRQRDSAPVRLLPVPSRVEDAEQVKLEAGRDFARHSFAGLMPDLSGLQEASYWGEAEIPYRPYYAYEEILAVFGDRPGAEHTLLAAYERLTAIITDGRITKLVPLPEVDRRRWLSEYERQHRGEFA